MHNLRSESNSNEAKTPFSICADYNAIERSSTIDLVEEVATPTPKPYAPWYATVKPQPLVLSEKDKAIVLSSNGCYQSDTVALKTQFWQDLALYGLKHEAISYSDIDELIEAPIGSLDQIEAAKSIASNVLSKFSDVAAKQTEIVDSKLSSLPLNKDISDWYNSPNESWGFNISVVDADYYGEDFDELDKSFNGLAVRIEHDSRISALSFDLDNFSSLLGKLYFKTIRLISLLNNKTLAIDICGANGCLDDIQKAFIDNNLSEEQLVKIVQSDSDTLVPLLTSWGVDTENTFGRFIDEWEIISAARHQIDMLNKGWYCEDSSIDFSITIKEAFTRILTELNTIRLNAINPTDKKGKETLEGVLKTLIELSKPICNCPWIGASDTPLDSFAYISFDTEIENEALEMENEHRQSIGESGALRLDLTSGESGFALIENIILADNCLLRLASV